MQITTIGLDLATHWFQVHGVDTAGKVVVKRRLRRTEVGAFSAPKNPAWLEWKPARRRTIGRAS